MTTITWYTKQELDKPALSLILSGLKENRRTRDAVLEIREPTECDPAEVYRIIDEAIG